MTMMTMMIVMARYPKCLIKNKTQPGVRDKLPISNTGKHV